MILNAKISKSLSKNNDEKLLTVKSLYMYIKIRIKAAGFRGNCFMKYKVENKRKDGPINFTIFE